ncbi:hypothetical protein AB1484_27220 [Parafrankia sp. FMc6]
MSDLWQPGDIHEASVSRSEHDRAVAELRAELAELRARIEIVEATGAG